ncbi:MAG TPA: hypothetical protein VGE85_07365 [Terracidiphilus sp.]|jgi:hypothetical protein
MSSDYKYATQIRAEELAEEEFGADFYSLPAATQDKLFSRAEASYWDDLFDAADNARKAARERE